eukprot:262524-Alexandrium_andersonii.AAC.1
MRKGSGSAKRSERSSRTRWGLGAMGTHPAGTRTPSSGGAAARAKATKPGRPPAAAVAVAAAAAAS